MGPGLREATDSVKGVGTSDSKQPEPSRRSVLGRILGGVSALMGAIVAALIGDVTIRTSSDDQMEDWVELGQANRLLSTPQLFEVSSLKRRGWMVSRLKSAVYAYRNPDGEVRVLSSTCTHLGCSVRWLAERGEFECPCHGGLYDSAGRVLSGPPPTDLKRLASKIQEGKVLFRRT